MNIEAALAAAHDLAVLPNRRPALQLLREILVEDPYCCDALALYASCLRSEGSLDEAYEVALRAVASEPQDPSALAGLGWSKFLADEDGEAYGLALAAIAADPDSAEGWWLRGHWSLHHRRFDEAERVSSRLLELDPTDEDGLILLGKSRLGLGQTELAAEAFEAALRIQPDSAEARNGLARVAMLGGENARALALAGEAARIQPAEHDEAVEFLASYGLFARMFGASSGGRIGPRSALAVSCLALGVGLIALTAFAIVASGSWWVVTPWFLGIPLTFLSLGLAFDAALPWGVRGRHLWTVSAIHLAIAAAAFGELPWLGIEGARPTDFSVAGALVSLLLLEFVILDRSVFDLEEMKAAFREEAADLDATRVNRKARELSRAGFEMLRDGRYLEAQLVFRRALSEDEEFAVASTGLEMCMNPAWAAYKKRGPDLSPSLSAWLQAPAWVRGMRNLIDSLLGPILLVCLLEAAVIGGYLAVPRYCGLVMGLLLVANGLARTRSRPERLLHLTFGILTSALLVFGVAGEVFGLAPPPFISWLSPEWTIFLAMVVYLTGLRDAAVAPPEEESPRP